MDDNQNLAGRIEELEKWKEQQAVQQISFPLDVQSQKILNIYFLSKISNLDFESASGHVFPNLIIQQNGHQYVVSVQENLVLYTADSSTDVLILGKNITTGAQGSFPNGTQVVVSTTNSTPTPLVDSVPYYVVNASGNTIKLSLTSGGAAINLTDNGVGQQYIQFFN